MSSNSPKKRTNEFIVVVKKNLFVCFLGEFVDTKSPFEIIWPFYTLDLFWNCYVIFHFRNRSLICIIFIKFYMVLLSCIWMIPIFFGLENKCLNKADMWVTFKWYTQTFWCAVWQFDWAGMTGQIHHHLRRKIALHNGLASFLKIIPYH